MAITSFIPKVWSARLLENLHNNTVFYRLVNHDYENDLKNYGDTVHINSLRDVTIRPYVPGEDLADPEQLSGDDMTLTMNHAVYMHFYLDDIDSQQAAANVLESACQMAARRLDEDAETYLIGVLRSEAGIELTLNLSRSDIFTCLIDLKTAMDERNVPRVGRKLVVPPTLEGELLKDSRFVSAGGDVAENAIADGAVARACGFDIFVSNYLDGEMIAIHPSGVTYAENLTKTEIYRRDQSFSDACKIIRVSGARVILPDCVALVTVS